MTDAATSTLLSSVPMLLTYQEAGEVLGVTDRTVSKLVAEGGLRAVRFGRSVRIDPADLRAYIDNRKTACRCDGGEQ